MFQQAIPLAADNPELWRNFGVALEAAGDRGEAIAAYRLARSPRPDWGLIHHNLANALLEAGAADEARAACETWLALEPGQLDAIGLLPVALDELGDRAGATRPVDLDRFVRRSRSHRRRAMTASTPSTARLSSSSLPIRASRFR